MKTAVFGISDVGRRREANQDQFLVDSEHGVFAIADGMGGHAAGEVASQIAIQALDDTLAGPEVQAAADRVEAERKLRSAVAEGNQRICDSVLVREEWRGMGTTLVALLIVGERVLIGHVGDSRAYRLRNGRLERLTNDHSWVGEQVKLGLMTDEEAARHPMRNIVTRALGNRPEVEVEVQEERFRDGDTFLLCSDGLNSMLGDDEIQATIEGLRDTPEAACRALVERANANGGDDNITVIVLTVLG